MKIAIDFRPVVVAPCSGIARQASALYRACQSIQDVEAIPCTEAPLDHSVRDMGLCPKRAAQPGMQRPLPRIKFEAGFLPKALDKAGVDLYVATANMGLPLGRKGRRKQVVLVHDLFQLTERNFHRSRFKALAYRVIDWLSIAWSIRTADAVWCPSDFSAGEVVRLFPGAHRKVRVLPNHVAPLPVADEMELPELEQPFWLLVGTREPRKNISFFVETWRQLRTEQQLPELVLVGETSDFPALQDVKGIHWMSRLTDAQLAGLYLQAQCLWQPSYAEGFGMPVVEALSVGTPAALAAGSALDEVAPDCLPRFSPFDSAELAACMRKLAQDPLPKKQQTYADWSERYGMKAYAARVEELVQELLPLCND